jgi:hypothetical protein
VGANDERCWRELLWLWFVWAFLPHLALLLKHLAVILDQSFVVPQCSVINAPVYGELLPSSCLLTIQHHLVKGLNRLEVVEQELMVLHQASLMDHHGLTVVS